MSSPDISPAEIERQVASLMEKHGVTPPSELILDGRVRRYAVEADRHGGKSGAYQIHPDGWPAGWFQDFHLGEPIRWKFQSDAPRARGYHAPAPSREVREEREAERQKENAEKLQAAWEAYQAARPVEEASDHPYLAAKRVQPRGGFLFRERWSGLRVGSVTSQKGIVMRNMLLIPTMDIETGQFCGLHRVLGWPGPDEKFSKGWSTPSGGVYPIGADVQSGPVICCEGISTGLALYELWAVELRESAAVLCAMDAGNLARQASKIKERYCGRELYASIDLDAAGRKVAAACEAAGFSGILEPPREAA